MLCVTPPCQILTVHFECSPVCVRNNYRGKVTFSLDCTFLSQISFLGRNLNIAIVPNPFLKNSWKILTVHWTVPFLLKLD